WMGPEWAKTFGLAGSAVGACLSMKCMLAGFREQIGDDFAAQVRVCRQQTANGRTNGRANGRANGKVPDGVLPFQKS
ncbi:MAG: hypothetical protein ACRDQ0_23055, partial [Pseudonocardia sp.]